MSKLSGLLESLETTDELVSDLSDKLDTLTDDLESKLDNLTVDLEVLGDRVQDLEDAADEAEADDDDDDGDSESDAISGAIGDLHAALMIANNIAAAAVVLQYTYYGTASGKGPFFSDEQRAAAMRVIGNRLRWSAL